MRLSFGGITDLIAKLGSGGAGGDGASVLGIDIGTSTIKLVQLKEKKGAAILETYGEIALGPYGNAEVGQSVNATAEKIGEALTDLMREANATSKTGGIAVPLSASLISVITLPTKNHEDLASMVPIEARKYIPVPVSEVALDWFVIPEEETQFLGTAAPDRPPNATDVLLVAIQKQSLTKNETIAKAAGVTPKFFEVEPFSFARASYEHGTAPILMIDCGASSTRVYVIEFGIISVSHTINRGGQDITLALSKSKGIPFTEAETLKRNKGIEGEETGKAALDYVFSEARRIVLTYQRKSNKVVSKVVLVGGGAELKGLLEVARTYFDAPIALGTPFDRVGAPAFITDVLSGAGPSFASAVGLALRALEQK
jgi:type IV pilus assembly protein PilM